MNAFDKVIGYSYEKRELEKISDTLKNREAYRKLGVSSPKGLLLYGEPGLGKTLMANCLIEASGRPAFVCRKDQPNGDFVKTIKATFEEAVKSAPSIVLLDDLDKFANEDENHKNAEEYVTVQSCIDEIRGKEVFVLATVNNMRSLPRSLCRAGRFDRTMGVEAPRGADAEKIITHYLNGKRFVKGVDAKTIARIMDGRSCAELETVINEAGLVAGFERAEEISMDHFLEACLKTVFDVSDEDEDDDEWWDDYRGEKTSKLNTSYHEAGHVTVSEILCPGSVTLASVYSRGSVGGFTSYYDAKTLAPVDWTKSRIVSSLGGMAAVEQKFGVTDSGCSKDLDQAFQGTMNLISDLCVCGLHLHGNGYNDTQELKAKQEQAAATEVERYYRKAKEIISLNSEFYEKIAEALSEKGLITMLDIQDIKNKCNLTSVAV